MKRRTLLFGTGTAAAGGAGLVGSGAFSGVVSKRDAKIAVAHDRDAYLGLRRSDGPNRSYVDYDRRGHLRLRMDRKNPTEGGGTGVNSDSVSRFDDLFRVCNQGKSSARIFLLKRGPRADRVTFYHGSSRKGYEVVSGQRLAVSDCLRIGLSTRTKHIASSTQLLRQVVVVAIADDAVEKDVKPETILEAIEIDGDGHEWVLNEP